MRNDTGTKRHRRRADMHRRGGHGQSTMVRLLRLRKAQEILRDLLEEARLDEEQLLLDRGRKGGRS